MKVFFIVLGLLVTWYGIDTGAYIVAGGAMFISGCLVMLIFEDMARNRHPAATVLSGSVNEQREYAMRVLELKEGFTKQELVDAYRRMARQYHPDRLHENAGQDLQEINKAYETLKG